MKELIGLKPGLNTFHRDVRDKDGNMVELLRFEPGIARELSKEHLAAIADDLGNTLGCVTEDEEGKQRLDPDFTHECVVGIAKSKLEAGKQLKPHQAQAMELEKDKKKVESKTAAFETAAEETPVAETVPLSEEPEQPKIETVEETPKTKPKGKRTKK